MVDGGVKPQVAFKGLPTVPKHCVEAGRASILATHSSAGMASSCKEACRLLRTAESLCRAAVAAMIAQNASVAVSSAAGLAAPARPRRKRRRKDKKQSGLAPDDDMGIAAAQPSEGDANGDCDVVVAGNSVLVSVGHASSDPAGSAGNCTPTAPSIVAASAEGSRGSAPIATTAAPRKKEIRDPKHIAKGDTIVVGGSHPAAGGSGTVTAVSMGSFFTLRLEMPPHMAGHTISIDAVDVASAWSSGKEKRKKKRLR